MSQAAMIVHEILDSPERWSDRGDGFITNGYYNVALSGTSYGMSNANYQATGTEADILQKAIRDWKDITGWTPKAIPEVQTSRADHQQLRMTPDTYVRKAYEEFAFSVRSNFRSYRVHNDAAVLSSGIQMALGKLDQVLKPVESLEGKKRNQEGGQEGSLQGA